MENNENKVITKDDPLDYIASFVAVVATITPDIQEKVLKNATFGKSWLTRLAYGFGTLGLYETYKKSGNKNDIAR